MLILSIGLAWHVVWAKDTLVNTRSGSFMTLVGRHLVVLTENGGVVVEVLSVWADGDVLEASRVQMSTVPRDYTQLKRVLTGIYAVLCCTMLYDAVRPVAGRWFSQKASVATNIRCPDDAGSRMFDPQLRACPSASPGDRPPHPCLQCPSHSCTSRTGRPTVHHSTYISPSAATVPLQSLSAASFRPHASCAARHGYSTHPAGIGER